MTTPRDRTDASAIIARLEDVPFTAFHARVLGTIGLAHLFDAFDALILAFILPSLIAEWRLAPTQAGLLLSVGYMGQFCGAVALSALAERIGRRTALQIALGILATLSLASAAAPGLLVLLLTRFVQGIGLGGEVPIAASYLNELCPARFRGRLIYTLQAIFAAGTLVTALVAAPLIPVVGWRAMFLIGTAPIALAAVLRLLIPESPRWLLARGRVAEAERIVAGLEARARQAGRALPAPVATRVPDGIAAMPAGDRPAGGGHSSIADLFRQGLARRTLSAWVIAFCLSIAGYGVLSWMPTLYTQVFHLPLRQALAYGMAPGLASVLGALLGVLLIERAGRRRCFLAGFLGGGAALLYLAIVPADALTTMLVSGVAMLFLTLLLGGIFVYAPEIYPTRVRALGTGAATGWMRVASIVGPIVVGALIGHAGIRAVFLFFAVAAVVGLATVYRYALETRGLRLEDIAPAP